MKKGIVIMGILSIIGLIIWMRNIIVQNGVVNFLIVSFIVVSVLAILGLIIYAKVQDNG